MTFAWTWLLLFCSCRQLDWRPEKKGEVRKRHEKVVIIRNMFHPSDFEVKRIICTHFLSHTFSVIGVFVKSDPCIGFCRKTLWCWMSIVKICGQSVRNLVKSKRSSSLTWVKMAPFQRLCGRFKDFVEPCPLNESKSFYVIVFAAETPRRCCFSCI